MTKVNYDEVAPAYDQRYVNHEFPGTEATLRRFVAGAERVLEVGCGTGHWLAQMHAWGCKVSGLDPSAQMLARAATRAAHGTAPALRGGASFEAQLVRGRAEALPWRDASFDRVVCVNALHHVEGKPSFMAEARRVLRPGGRFLSIGLDPSAGLEPWSIYEYFETTLELDRQRYPAAAQLRSWLADAGFVDCVTEVAERIVFDRSARECLDRNLLAKESTSQLSLLSDEQYQRGIDRIRRDLVAAETAGESLHLTADLRLYATTANVRAATG
jgi:ubiquinone/menaquinone biosynthesis C-methylase UbiE